MHVKIQIRNTLYCTKAEPCRLLIAVSARGNQGGGWRQLFALRWIIDGKTASDRPLYFWIFFQPYLHYSRSGFSSTIFHPFWILLQQLERRMIPPRMMVVLLLGEEARDDKWKLRLVSRERLILGTNRRGRSAKVLYFPPLEKCISPRPWKVFVWKESAASVVVGVTQSAHLLLRSPPTRHRYHVTHEHWITWTGG